MVLRGSVVSCGTAPAGEEWATGEEGRAGMDPLVSKTRRAVGDVMRKVAAGLARPETESPYTNIFHACVHRTGSQWLRKFLADPIVYQYSGLRTYHYQSHMPD